VETGHEAALHLDAPALARYQGELTSWLAEVESHCRAANLGYTLVRSDAPLPRLFLNDLKRAGLVC